ncbi:hypothetical protein ACFL6C_12725, partial [Myxococcota bacterium]
LEDWPEDVFITAQGIQSLPVSEPVKAILIFEQMARIDSDCFLAQAHATSLADVFSQAANDKVCEELGKEWWTGLEDPDAPLRIMGEMSLEDAMPKDMFPLASWCFPYDLVVTEWDGDCVKGELHSREDTDGARLSFKAWPDELWLYVVVDDGRSSEHRMQVAAAPTALLEDLKRGLEPYLPENTKGPLKKLREQAEKDNKGSVRPLFDSIKAVLESRAEALARAKSALEGASRKNVGKRTKKRLTEMADGIVEK